MQNAEINISEIFYSIQGEGLLAGRPSVFIRLAGCPLRCKYCDTVYALDAKAGIDMNPVISNSLIMLHWPILPSGQGGEMMRFSPDGTRFITVYDSLSEFCQFNSSTGQITPMFHFNTLNIPPNGTFATAEFSIDNRFLYISRWDGYCPCMKIYQYDASKTDSAQFIQSEVLIHQTNKV